MTPDELETSGLLRTERRPVVLPSDDGGGHVSDRYFVTILAVLVVFTAAAGGLFYRYQWQDASHDVTRLLPASTSVFVHVPRPWASLTATHDLDRWQDATELVRASATQGLLADGLGGRLAGIPFAAVRRAALSMDALRIAVVPAARATAVFFFVEIGDPWARQRVMAQLIPHLERVDHVLGYDVLALKTEQPWLPWTGTAAPMRLIEMDNQVVLAIGAADALVDLIHARVGGRSQPLRTRQGFDAEAAVDRGATMWTYVAPGTAWDALAEAIGPHVEEALNLRSGVLELLHGTDARASLVGGDDRLDIKLSIARTPLMRRLTRAISGRHHELLGEIAADASFITSAAVEQPAELVQIARELLSVADLDALGPDIRLARSVADRALGIIESADELTLDDVLTGNMIVGQDSDGGWFAVASVTDPALADAFFDRALAVMFGPSWTYGAIRTDADGQPLHIARLETDPATGEVAPSGPIRQLAWRVRGDAVRFAGSDRALLQLEARAARGALAFRNVGLRRAIRSLPLDSPVMTIVSSDFVARLPAPWPRVLAPLDPEFRLALAFDVADGALRIRTNTGAFTLAAALAAADRLTVDSLLLADLPPECVAAYLAMCRSAAPGPLCEPLQLGRHALLSKACDRL